jgi:hypothetical protein
VVAAARSIAPVLSISEGEADRGAGERARPHRVVGGYDKRADVEKLIGEAQREAGIGNSVEAVFRGSVAAGTDSFVQERSCTA